MEVLARHWSHRELELGLRIAGQGLCRSPGLWWLGVAPRQGDLKLEPLWMSALGQVPARCPVTGSVGGTLIQEEKRGPA